MKSVIAQGATISKAIEEALQKAGMPKEFFIKLLVEGRSGFLGFGSTKAKIALFYKEVKVEQPEHTVLAQSSYKNLFNNKDLQMQIDQQEKVENKETHPVIPRPQQKKKHYRNNQNRVQNQRSKSSEQQIIHHKQEQKQLDEPQKQQVKKEIKEIKVRQLDLGKDKQQEKTQDIDKKKNFQRRPRRKSSWGHGRRRSQKVNNGNDSNKE